MNNSRIVCTIIGLYYVGNGWTWTGAALIIGSWLVGR